MRVIATAGRDLGRTREATATLARELGHDVEARDGLDGLFAPGDLDALIVAAPVEAHLAGLQAALAGSVHVLCEKPFVTLDETEAVASLCAEFAERGLVLFENCQWPEVLPTFVELHGRIAEPPRAFEMRLSPSFRKGGEMIEDSLSHYLSLLQAMAPVDASTRMTHCEFSTREPDREELTVRLGFAEPFDEIRGALHLVRCPEQPRPVWIEIDGRRLDRRVRLEDYSMLACDGDRSIALPDPLESLVAKFATAIRSPGSERVPRHDAIVARARLFDAVVRAFGAPR